MKRPEPAGTKVKGLFKQPGSKNYYTKVKGIVQTTGTDQYPEALQTLRRRQGQAANGEPLFRRLDQIRYEEGMADLLAYYEATGSRNLKEVMCRVRNLDRFFKGKHLHRVAADVNGYIAMRRKEGAAPKTINVELEVVVRMLRLAYENNKLVRLPVIHRLKVNNVRKGFFESEMFERVKRYLPDDYMVAVTIENTYGWRTQSEVLRLEWRMIDLAVGTMRLGPGMTKNDDGRVVYLTDELMDLLTQQLARIQALERQLGRIIPYVFPHLRGPYLGTRVKDFKVAWATACKKAGCPGMLRHDFRRTAVRNMERAGVVRSVAMKMTGHKSESVYKRYDIVSDGDLKTARDQLMGIVSGIVPETTGPQESVSR